jgi:HK97 family phage major capsid protein
MSARPLPHVLAAVQNQVWAIEPGFGRRMLAVLERKLDGRELSAEAKAAFAQDQAPRVSSQTGSVMVIPIYGVLLPRADRMQESCGVSSVTRLMRDFDTASANADISVIVLEFDSGGGSVALIPEFAAKIRATTKIKDVIAVINPDCHSAAYWLAAQCTEVVITESGETGAVGCFMLHLSTAAADQQEGYEWTLIKAGDYKAEGLEQFKLEEDAKNYLQTRVDEYYNKFVAGIAKGREVSVKDVRDNFGQGRSMSADAAVAAGLADRIGTFDDVLAKLTGKARRPVMKAEGAARVLAAGVMPEVLASASVGLAEVVDVEAHQVAEATLEESVAAKAPYVIPTIEPTARGGAVDSAVPSPAPAPKAKEKTMEDDLETGAAPGGAGAAVAAAPGKDAGALALTAERLRTKGLNALGKEHTVDKDVVAGWIDNGVTVQAARDEILKKYAAGSTAHAPRATAGEPNEGKRPFSSIGEQLQAIQRAGIAMKSGGVVDPRLHRVNREVQAALGGIESTPSDAGFALQADLSLALIDPLFEKGEVLSRVRRVPFAPGRNKIEILAADEVSRVNGQRLGGVQMFWRAEGDPALAKRPKTRLITMDAKKIIGLAYASNESEEDVGLMTAIYEPAFREELEFMVEDSIFRAKGAGQPLGFLSSDAPVSQAIEAGQTIANTPQSIALNLANMLSRIPPRMQKRAVWFYNPSLLPKLVTATLGAGGAAAPVFLPANGIAGSPSNTIYGLPAFSSEYCEAEGTPGDLVLVVLDQYLWADKGGAKTSQSVHVQFVTDEVAFKLTYRCDGQPIWRVPVAPYKGANPFSPFVTLAVRV